MKLLLIDFFVDQLVAVVLNWEGLRHAASRDGWERMLAFTVGAIGSTLLEYLLHRHIFHRLPPLLRAKQRQALHHRLEQSSNFGATTGLWNIAFGSTRQSVKD